MVTLALLQAGTAATHLATAGLVVGALALRRVREPERLGGRAPREATALSLVTAALLVVRGVGLLLVPAGPAAVPVLATAEALLVTALLAACVLAAHRARPASMPPLRPWLAALAVAALLRHAVGGPVLEVLAPSVPPLPVPPGPASVAPVVVAAAYLLVGAVRARGRGAVHIAMFGTTVACLGAGVLGAGLAPGPARALLVGLWPVPVALALVLRALDQGRTIQRSVDRVLERQAVQSEVLVAGAAGADVDEVLAAARDRARTVLGRPDLDVRVHLLPQDRAEVEVVVPAHAPPLDVTGRAFGDALGLALSSVAERRWLTRRLDRTVRTDPLTGLANRLALDARLQAAVTAPDPRPLTLLLADVDGFRAVNDVHGHQAGDALLGDVGRHLQRAAGTAFVARLGADQFVVLVDERLDGAATERLAGRLGGPVTSGAHVQVRLTLGTGTWVPGEDEGSDALLHRAEAALLEARRTGATWLPFDVAMEERAAGEHRRRAAMLAAVADRRFVAHYQPIVCARSLTVVGAEALARWVDGGTPVAPALWLPLAESSGLVVPIGADMLRQAAATNARTGLPVSVNVAPQQLTDAGFLDAVDAAWGDRPFSELTLEITEGALMATQEVLPVLTALRDRGARISLDDFGTGYSSLARLADLPVDELKIDRSFVVASGTDQGRAVLAAILELARAHGLDVVAEGVEDAAQLAVLTALGVDHVQGYLLGRPAPEPVSGTLLVPGVQPQPDAGVAHRARWAGRVRSAASASAPTGGRAAR
ncbi:putative bifunctional diguanylate cyclase/phosphodiesterase [Cellulomonas endophytica]|uniref:putative bifunctional diguanylate cyclase/phosphodiesterase n=1 Tax=Cellulomonas endophytica TaxID=2494735 RepID=UPI0010102BF0|nr:bifunctional diguanylate cyclase/phosphodiesterase [Cellulomonas endophytica]